MNGEILVRGETVHVAGCKVMQRERPADAEVAGSPRLRAAEVPCEVPVRGPVAQTAHGRDPRFHLVVRQRRELVVGQLRAGDADDVLRLAVREADGEEVVRLGRGDDVLARELQATPTWRPKRSMNRLRILNATISEICCAEIDVTSDSNGSGTSGGRKPRRRSTTGASSGSEAAKS